MKTQLLRVLILLLPGIEIFTAKAHKEPNTANEIQVQRALREAAYHCAPTVARYTAERQHQRQHQLSWTQHVLSSFSGASTYQGFFKATVPSRGDSDSDSAAQDLLLSCARVPERHQARIRNNTCVLAPESTEGPYYHPAEHPIRQNIAELQDGLLLLLDIGVIDVETCNPVPNILVDIWHANATGHYAGHPVPAPEYANEKPQVGGKRAGLLMAYPRTNSHETYLRGAWPTNENGVAQFTTVFPGYYAGRATHIHTKVFTEWTAHSNGTYSSDALAHAGQFYFEDEINIRVDNMHPYTLNPIRDSYGRTRNWRDSRNFFEDSFGPEGGDPATRYNPVFELELLGGVISQGLMGYITMGVNLTASYDNFWKIGI